MKYKYKIDYKSIGGSSSTSTTSSSASSDNTSGSTTFDNKIEYIDTIMNNLGYEEGNNRIFYISEYTPLSDKIYDYVQKIKNKWEKSKNLNPNERIIELLNLLEKKSLKIENFNIFYTELFKRAVDNWFYDQNHERHSGNFYGSISNWDTSYVTSMSYSFANRENFNEDISRWNVSNVTNMSNMFDGATTFNQNIGSWNVKNVKNMGDMFRNAKSFNGDISTWDTSNVKFMERMFEGAESFNQNINTKSIENSDGEISYTAWDVSNVEYLSNMFKGATSFNGIVSGWTLKNTSGSLGSGLNINLNLKDLTGNREIEKIIINPFYTVADLKQKLHKQLINKYGELGNNIFRNLLSPQLINKYRDLNILIDIPLEEKQNLSNEAFLQNERLQDQRELRSYGIQNNDTLTYEYS